MNTARERLALALQWNGTTKQRLVDEAVHSGPIVRRLLDRIEGEPNIAADDLEEDDWDAALYLEQALHVCDGWLVGGTPSIAARRLLDELTLIEINGRLEELRRSVGDAQKLTLVEIAGRLQATGTVVVSAEDWELLKLRAASVPGQTVHDPQH